MNRNRILSSKRRYSAASRVPYKIHCGIANSNIEEICKISAGKEIRYHLWVAGKIQDV